MRKLRLQFGIFFILLSCTVGFLLLYSFRQMNREERELWKGIAEKVYNHFQSQISDVLTEEDQRSFYQYSYNYFPEGQQVRKGVQSLSPLSKLPRNNVRGLIGYFQIDPDNSFSTPYLPTSPKHQNISHEPKRRRLYARLKDLTHSLRAELHEGTQLPKQARLDVSDLNGESALSFSTMLDLDDITIDLGIDLKQEPSIKRLRQKLTASGNIYPNPLQEQQRKLETKKFRATKSVKPKLSEGATQKPEMDRPQRPVAAAPSAPETSKNIPQGHGVAGSPTEPEAQKPPPPASQPTATSPPSIIIDPLQARLATDEYLIFYRKVWLNQELYVQGFVVAMDRFFSWMMGRSFANSDLPRFAVAQLTIGDRSLLEYGSEVFEELPGALLFARSLGYPLDQFAWKVYASFIPHVSARLFLYVLTAIILSLMTVGLYLIYRSAAAQVQLSQKRQDFVSSVTHELKTPLTSIRMYSEMLEDGWAKDEQKEQEYYRHINKESGRLSRLIENVLQLARLEKGNYRLNCETVSPDEDFYAIGHELEGIAIQQGFKLSVQAESELQRISYDREALKQIMLTLLDNSLKFATDAKSKDLEMTLTRSGNSIIWSWRDRGPGIPERELKKVFQKFYRAGNELTRRTTGTGIGLAMAKMIIEAMGAKIEILNRSEGGLEVRLIFQAALL